MHVTLFSSSFLHERFSKSDENGGTETFLYEHVFKCTFSRGKVGPRPLPWGGGVVHVKIQTGMLIQSFGFEIRQILFWGECQKLVLFV